MLFPRLSDGLKIEKNETKRSEAALLFCSEENHTPLFQISQRNIGLNFNTYTADKTLDESRNFQ